LQADRADVGKRLARLEQQIKQFRSENRAAGAPARSVRRATARRASTRRATARSHQTNTTARITEFLTSHPQSTAGDLARSLNLDPGSVSRILNRLAYAGEIKYAHGSSAQQPTRDRKYRRSHPL
jgi:CRP-like cAMP-binding protein